MPKYLNSTANDITHDGERLPSREEITIDRFLATPLPSGVTKTADAPIYNPVLVSSVETGNDAETASVAIPATYDGAVLIRVDCTAGGVRVRLTDGANDPPFEMKAGSDPFQHRILARVATSVELEFTEASSVAVVNVLKS